MIIRLSVLGILLAGAAVAQEGDNLLADPGFEAGEDAPSAWTFNHRDTDGEIAWDDTRAASGERSVRLTNAEGQTGNVLQTVHVDPPLPPGSRVAFSALSASRDASSAPRIVVYLQPPVGRRETLAAGGVPGTHDFAPVRGQGVSGRSVARIVVYLCHYGTGTAWWDDASLTVERAEERAIIPRPPAAEDLAPLRADDGLSLALNDACGLSAVRVEGTDLSAAVPSGLWLRPWRGDTVPVTGALTVRDGAVAQTWESEELRLRVTATWSVDGDAITCRGDITDLRGEDRALQLMASLPVGDADPRWRWWQDINTARSLLPETEDGAADTQPVPQAQAVDDLTFSAMSQGDAAIALSVPADSPCDCSFRWSPELGYHVSFQLGLSPAASGDLRSRAPFAFTVYRVDPAGGLRDAARRYYEMNAWAFEKRVEREGLWMFGSPRIDLPDPQNYAFHEGGPRGWEFDEEHGIATCPYIIPGQREIKRLDSLPESPAEAREVFEAWEPEANDRPRGWGHQMKDIIRNCMLYDAAGDPVVQIRNTPWGGNSITFPLNANPWLLADAAEPTIARVLLEAVRAQHDETPELDGSYVDSLGHWGNFKNFRREHFAAERIPLTCDLATGRPVVSNRFTLLEFLWELRDSLHERGKLLFANGVHPNRRFHFFALDVMGVEGRSRLEQKRTMAGSKPFLLLIYGIHEDPAAMERWFNRCAHWGIYPSFGNMSLFDTQEKYAPIAALNNRFVPVMRQITGAGWRPVTHARSERANVLVERWGPGEEGEVFLTVFSEAEGPVESTLTVEATALGLDGAELSAEDLLDGAAVSAPIDEGQAVLTVPVRPGVVRVLRLRAR